VTACAEAGHKHQCCAFGEVGYLCRDRPFFCRWYDESKF